MWLKDELPRPVDVQYATGEEWRNSFRKNEEAEPKQKQCPAGIVTGDGSEGVIVDMKSKEMGKQWETLFWRVPKSLEMVTAAMKLKDACSLEEKL